MKNKNAKIFLEIYSDGIEKRGKNIRRKRGEHDSRNVSSFSGSEEKSTHK